MGCEVRISENGTGKLKAWLTFAIESVETQWGAP
jgi:hypothetical protein